VDVVGVAVVARAHGDDRLQRRRAPRRHLQAVEAAPGDAEHPDLAAAPLLLDEPVDDLEGVVVLLCEVLVREQAVGVAAPAQVDAHAGVAVVGEVRVVALVARGERVALAVREVLEDRGDGLRIVGQPQPGREPGAVGQRDPDVVHPAHWRTLRIPDSVAP
jgi:hypothetical protein